MLIVQVESVKDIQSAIFAGLSFPWWVAERQRGRVGHRRWRVNARQMRANYHPIDVPDVVSEACAHPVTRKATYVWRTGYSDLRAGVTRASLLLLAQVTQIQR